MFKHPWLALPLASNCKNSNYYVMSRECANIHTLAHKQVRHSLPFDESLLPKNGIYFLFEKSEHGHGQDRIVRAGTHRGDNQLLSRLKQHFIQENKDRSIFRKNIGRVLLAQADDPFLEYWEKDLTTRKAKDKYARLIDFEYQRGIENEVSQYIQNNFSFSVIEVQVQKERLQTESVYISAVSWCDECGASPGWVGNHSPKEKIKKSGLWQVNELYKKPS